MTNEEAIKELKAIRKDYIKIISCDALDTAIKALESQPCEDAVSREAVIRLVEQYPNIIGNRCSGLILDIKHLPSVTPRTKSEEAIHAQGFVDGVKACIEKLNEMG